MDVVTLSFMPIGDRQMTKCKFYVLSMCPHQLSLVLFQAAKQIHERKKG